MANIALVTADTTHAAYTTTKAAIESTGHTVTGFNMSAVTNVNLASFDAIVCVRCLTNNGSYAAFVPLLKGYIAGGKATLVSYDSASGSGTGTAGLPVELKLAERLTATSGGPTTIRAVSNHPVWAQVGATIPSDYTVLTGGTFTNKVDITGAYAGEAIGVYSSSDASPVLLLANAGSMLLGSTTATAKLAYAAFIYGGAAYTANGSALIDALIDWLTTNPAQIVGTVKDDLGAPLSRVVRAYQRSNGAFAGAAVSSAVDGTFTILVGGVDQLHYVVALDEVDGEQNAIVKDRVMPYLG